MLNNRVNTNNNAPWKVRYKAPAILFSRFAPLAPVRGVVATDQSGTIQWYGWNLLTGQLHEVTNTPGGHTNFLYISPDGNWFYYLKDQQGNEIGHYVRVPFEGGEPEDITPDIPEYSSDGFAFSRDGSQLGYQIADKNGFQIFIVETFPDGKVGKRKKIFESQHLCSSPFFSADGQTVFVMSSDRTAKNQFSIMAFDVASGKQLAELWDGGENTLEIMASCPIVGDHRILATTTKSGIETLLIWNPRTGERIDLDMQEISGSMRAFDWSADGVNILFRTFVQASQQLYVYDLSLRQTRKLEYPSGTNISPYFSPDSKEVFSHWQDATHPPRLISLSMETGKQTRVILAAGEVPQGKAWKNITFISSDGQVIQGWLALPNGSGPFPTILETHGGPTSVEGNAFSPSSQAWLDHGFAYLSINYRGSTTFGREFEQKIWGDLGQWELEDMVAARNYLVDNGIAKADSILLTGWSYGGYLTLLGLGRRPDLWAGGMAGIAIADWSVQYEDSAETLRGYQRALFLGDPDEKPEQYRRSSPITYAENVRAPVLIIQGRNDTRTPARPIEMYEKKMKDLGKTIEVLWFDSGHAGSSGSKEQSIEFQEVMMKFAFELLSQK